MGSGAGRVLIKNVEIFDGLADRLVAGHVLIEGSTIAAVQTSPISESGVEEIIDGAGHWLQVEKPAETTAQMLRFLEQLGR